jgi:hypothetical protein
VGREADHSPASSAEIIKCECSCTLFLPYGAVLNEAGRDGRVDIDVCLPLIVTRKLEAHLRKLDKIRL